MIRQRRALVASLQERTGGWSSSAIRRAVWAQGRAGPDRARDARHRLPQPDGDDRARRRGELRDGGVAERALPAIERVSATGRQALVEMRRLLGVLRDDPDEHPLEPQPSLERSTISSRASTRRGSPSRSRSPASRGSWPTGSSSPSSGSPRRRSPTRSNTRAVRQRARRAAVRVRAGRAGGRRHRHRAGRGDAAACAASTGAGSARHARAAAAYGGELEAGPLSDGGWRVHLSLHADAVGRWMPISVLLVR